MRATWRFKAVRQDLTGFFIRRADGTGQLIGTDEEAPGFSVRVRHLFCDKSLQRVEACSTGLIDFSVANNKPLRELATLRPHENGRDWRAEMSRLHHGAGEKPRIPESDSHQSRPDRASAECGHETRFRDGRFPARRRGHLHDFSHTTPR
jgi:hypothetical protein